MTTRNELTAELAGHGARYAPRYRGFLSDHGPMATLALKQLGASDAGALAWYRRYVGKLEPADESFRSQRNRYLQDVERHGIGSVLDTHLPRLISGWVRDAYHPIIRLAYGYQAQLPEEVASALAYFELCGNCPEIESLARAPVHSRLSVREIPERLLQKAPVLAQRLNQSDTFTDRVNTLMRMEDFADFAFTLKQNLRQVSRLALDVFAHSHDFFALHLVTGAHAFRVLYPHIGRNRDRVFTLGVCAGYIAAGAPPRYDGPAVSAEEANPTAAAANAVASDAEPDWLELIDEDEHNIKLACSAAAQAAYFADPDYVRAGRDYLLATDRS